MQILVVAATPFEIAPFLEKYPGADYLITGIGSVVTAYQLCKKIQHKKYPLIIQAGIGGSFSAEIKPGDTVCVQKDCFADLAAIEKNQLSSVFDLGLVHSNEQPFRDGWLINPHLESFPTDLMPVTAVTVNLLTDDVAHYSRLQKKFGAQIESMEGAALHYVCLMENIPFLQLRGISNEVGERDKSKWKMKKAIKSVNRELMNVYDAFNRLK